MGRVLNIGRYVSTIKRTFKNALFVRQKVRLSSRELMEARRQKVSMWFNLADAKKGSVSDSQMVAIIPDLYVQGLPDPC